MDESDMPVAAMVKLFFDIPREAQSTLSSSWYVHAMDECRVECFPEDMNILINGCRFRYQDNINAACVAGYLLS